MASLVSGVMNIVHDSSLPTIELLQASFPENKDFMINISTLFDPRYVFLIYAPLLFAFNKRVGHRMIIALTLAEWANQILKWLLAGERPYWYVHERAHELAAAANFSAEAALEARSAALLGSRPLQLKQFPVTCELGAGSPSGHSMVTATVWYILIDAYLKGELPAFSRPDYRLVGARQSGLELATNKLARISWCIYTIMLVMVSLSRVYLACHFPHQCLAGAALGLVTARLVAEKLPEQRLAPAHFGLTTCFMFASALSTYALLRLLGVNPLWSVDKAMRWCVSKEYIHLDTTPFFSMMRYLGFCLGAGLAFDSAKISRSELEPDLRVSPSSGHLLARRLITALLGIAFGQFLLALPAPKSNLNLFYVISFIMYTVFSYAIASPIPSLAKRLFSSANSAKTTPGAKAKSR